MNNRMSIIFFSLEESRLTFIKFRKLDCNDTDESRNSALIHLNAFVTDAVHNVYDELHPLEFALKKVPWQKNQK